MRIISGRNVNDIYPLGRAMLTTEGILEPSRAGDVIVMPHPVMTVYDRPQERVLFDAERDANPFFHLFECIWMLAGSDDARWLDRYVGDFSKRFAESDGLMHGAYGKRWIDHFQIGEKYERTDQLEEAVKLLRRNKRDRQVVIAMWDPAEDLGMFGYKDRPCNTHLYIRVREDLKLGRDVLDLTIMCRSNDMIFGAYGANAVHMSFLQEYLAAGVGVLVGKMYQLSNNFHGYVDVLSKVPMSEFRDHDPYYHGEVTYTSVVDPGKWEFFQEDCREFVKHPVESTFTHKNDWFVSVARPMALAHAIYKERAYDAAIETMNMVQASDWAQAGRLWLQRRKERSRK